MLQQFKISNLFGIYNYNFDFCDEEGLSILIGPNGCGKTTVLKILENILKGNHQLLLQYDFEKIELRFNDHYLEIEKTMNLKLNNEEDLDTMQEPAPGITYILDGKIIKEKLSKTEYSIPFFEIYRELPFLRRIRPGVYEDRRNSTIYRSSKELIEGCYNDLPDHIQKKVNRIPIPIMDLLSDIKVTFISTNRLLEIKKEFDRDDISTYESTIENYALELKERLSKELTQYANISQKLDEEFPIKVIKLISKKTPRKKTNRSVTEWEQEIQELRSRLVEFGILQDNKITKVDTNRNVDDENTLAILDLYYEDMATKLHSLDNISQQVQQFIMMINRKSFSNKRLYVSPEKGFFFCQEKSEQIIPLKLLSSGEQHELLFLYELCFKIEENSIILIDEPEISLHVSWQRQFVEDMKKITKNLNTQIIIATHSPQIINENWDKVIKLGEVE